MSCGVAAAGIGTNQKKYERATSLAMALAYQLALPRAERSRKTSTGGVVLGELNDLLIEGFPENLNGLLGSSLDSFCSGFILVAL